ncbi:AlpA family transcriptional regulator [Advenella sp. FME57]|uniref:helix-turn-helix transcriptional regulator n=1 Tax=Advenella sp. FME57 TaxID=2742604 RepID=UPI0018696C30|nr:helix-turn-helix domain-containing protein [Advenella sp. FME57]
MNVVEIESPLKSLADDGLLTLSQAAKKVGIHRATLYQWISDGKFPKPAKISGRNYFRLPVLKDWLDQNAPEAKFDRVIVRS